MKNIFTRTCIASLLAVVLVCSVVMSAFAGGDYTTSSFTDAPKSSWCYIYVEKAHENGWINGYPDGRFGPNDQVTYAQLSVMLTQAFFKDKVNAYNGSTPSWYSKFCGVADDLGLFHGLVNIGGTFRVMKDAEADELATIFAPIFALFPSNATGKQKVEICVKEIVDRFDYETGTADAIFSWTNGKTRGNCESCSHAASQILAAAGIPNIQVKGGTKSGAHAWVLAYVDGTWMTVDGTSAEAGVAQPMTISAHEQRWGISSATNNTDSIKVARPSLRLLSPDG